MEIPSIDRQFLIWHILKPRYRYRTYELQSLIEDHSRTSTTGNRYNETWNTTVIEAKRGQQSKYLRETVEREMAIKPQLKATTKETQRDNSHERRRYLCVSGTMKYSHKLSTLFKERWIIKSNSKVGLIGPNDVVDVSGRPSTLLLLAINQPWIFPSFYWEQIFRVLPMASMTLFAISVSISWSIMPWQSLPRAIGRTEDAAHTRKCMCVCICAYMYEYRIISAESRFCRERIQIINLVYDFGFCWLFLTVSTDFYLYTACFEFMIVSDGFRNIPRNDSPSKCVWCGSKTEIKLQPGSP